MEKNIKGINKVKKYYKVTKSNILVDAVYSLSANEQKLLLTAISLLNPKDTEDFTRYRISISALKEILKIDTEDFYRQIQQITDSIMTKPFRYHDKEKNSELKAAWFSSCEYLNNEGIVEFEFSPKVKPFLLAIKENFTTYMLGYAVCLKSRFSIRIYEILKKVENMGGVTFHVNELKKMLGIQDKYKLYGHFKVRILEKAKDEINEHTDIRFRYEELKTARRVDRIRFYISPNKKNIITTKEPDLFGMTDISIRLEKLGVSSDRALEIINQYDDDYILDKIEQFFFEQKTQQEKILEVGGRKYLYNLLIHPEWKSDEYKLHKLQLQKKKRLEKEHLEKERLEKLQKEYDEHIDSFTPDFESLSEEEKNSINEEIDKRLKGTLTSAFKINKEAIEMIREGCKKEIIQESVKRDNPFQKWVENR